LETEQRNRGSWRQGRQPRTQPTATARDRDAVECQLCGQHYRFLPTHLTKHRLSTAEYRAEFGIPTEPLHSSSHGQVLSALARQPHRIELSRTKRRLWHEQRRAALGAIEQEYSLYVPWRAASRTGIPLQTLYSAIRDGRLPAVHFCLLVQAGHHVTRADRRAVQGIPTVALDQFAQAHRPKRKRSESA
jgi:hypothetical protein